jgi:hypothetical protein
MPALFSDAMEISNRAVAASVPPHCAFPLLTDVAELARPSEIS